MGFHCDAAVPLWSDAPDYFVPMGSLCKRLPTNTIAGNGRYGVALTYQAASATWADAISDHHTLTGNTVTDNVAAGVYFQGTTKTLVGSSSSTAGKNAISGNKCGLQLTGGSTGNAVHENNIVCASTTGKTCQKNAYSDMGSTVVDATNNWWGSADGVTIAQLIYGVGIQYSPWLNAPVN